MIRFRLLYLWVAIALAQFACSPSSTERSSEATENQVIPDSSYIAQSVDFALKAQQRLLGHVSREMKAGGTAAALPFCHTHALSITDSVHQELGVLVARISHKPRNPANAASVQEQTLLADWQKAVSSEQILTPALYRDKDAVRVYVPIRLGMPTCLSCHGSKDKEISPATQKLITDLYPSDQATGFAMGEVRGAWRFTWPL